VLRQTFSVFGSPIDVIGWQEAISRIAGWAAARESRYVCICNAHSVVTATSDAAFSVAVQQADMATPDGAPVAWLIRKQTGQAQHRINGPDLMWRYLAEGAGHGGPVFLYGGTEKTLQILRSRLTEAFPDLLIAGTYSPPFRSLTVEEDERVVEMINTSGASTVWVSLGCPKQEKWMAEHRGRIRAVMIGIGAAFDYHAGTLNRAPLWMQRKGLEWLHRLASEPGRLWKRYLATNSLFIFLAARQLLSGPPAARVNDVETPSGMKLQCKRRRL
jgi:N-acetylglucosaminyldiphosphoundecaprenol N-acetyl-beta-D-mannosaminyltransferase